jgi:hypothetical protein
MVAAAMGFLLNHSAASLNILKYSDRDKQPEALEAAAFAFGSNKMAFAARSRRAKHRA